MEKTSLWSLFSNLPDVLLPLCADDIDFSLGDDDHICSEPTTEEEESEPNSAHVNDVQNQPDAQGRVLVNLNHPPTDTDIFLSPQLARAIKPHQV